MQRAAFCAKGSLNFLAICFFLESRFGCYGVGGLKIGDLNKLTIVTRLLFFLDWNDIAKGISSGDI